MYPPKWEVRIYVTLCVLLSFLLYNYGEPKRVAVCLRIRAGLHFSCYFWIIHLLSLRCAILVVSVWISPHEGTLLSVILSWCFVTLHFPVWHTSIIFPVHYASKINLKFPPSDSSHSIKANKHRSPLISVAVSDIGIVMDIISLQVRSIRQYGHIKSISIPITYFYLGCLAIILRHF